MQVTSAAQMLEPELTCPISLEPLATAVSLVPCMHKVNQAAAEILFGKLPDGVWQAPYKEPCPICRREILGYSADHAVRQIVSKFLDMPPGILQPVYEKARTKIPEKSLQLKAPPLEALPYPCGPDTFKHTAGNWNVFPSGSMLTRELGFKSVNIDPTIKEFRLMGYKDGSISLSIVFICDLFNRDVREMAFKNYLESHGLITQGFHGGYYKAKTQEDVHILFACIAANNSIPEPQYTKMKEIVERGSCEPSNTTPSPFDDRRSSRLRNLL